MIVQGCKSNGLSPIYCQPRWQQAVHWIAARASHLSERQSIRWICIPKGHRFKKSLTYVGYRFIPCGHYVDQPNEHLAVGQSAFLRSRRRYLSRWSRRLSGLTRLNGLWTVCFVRFNGSLRHTFHAKQLGPPE